MSRALEVHKRHLRRLVGNAAGDNLDFPRVWLSGKQAESALGEIFALPIAAETVVDLNTADGSLVFIPGISDPGGSDVIL